MELEAGVVGFLASRSAVLRLVAVMDDLERLVAQVRSGASLDSTLVPGDLAAGNLG